MIKMIIKDKNKLKLETKSKILVLGFMLFILIGLITPLHFSFAQCAIDVVCQPPLVPTPDNCSCESSGTYHLLAPLPCTEGTPGCVQVNGNWTLATFDTTAPAGSQNNNLGAYLNMMLNIFIGICAVLAVIMIVLGGIEYMTSELISSKEAGKERITGAIFGLLLALSAWLILSTINPDILKTDLKSLTSVTVDVALGAESSTPFGTGISATSLQSDSIICPGNGGASELPAIATSFQGKATYNSTTTGRNTINADGTVNVDCSSYVDQVYTCAGLAPPGNTTANIFSGATSTNSANITTSADGKTISVNGTPLKPGDLLGWTAGQSGQSSGHVIMYIGNGQIIDAQGGANSGANQSVTARPLNSTMQSMITYFKPGP